MREEPHKDSPQPSGSEMAGASASVSTAPPGSGNRIPACPFLTALQIPLQPLPQPRCRNERSRISSSSCSSNPHCQSGMRLETRRMGAPSVRSPGGVRTCLSACRGEGLELKRCGGEGYDGRKGARAGAGAWGEACVGWNTK